jgi:hypothetical protein
MTNSPDAQLRVEFLISYVRGMAPLSRPGLSEPFKVPTELRPLRADELVSERQSHRGSSAFSGVRDSCAVEVDGFVCQQMTGWLGLRAIRVSVSVSRLEDIAVEEARLLDNFVHLVSAADPDGPLGQPLWSHRLVVSDQDLPPIIGLQYGESTALADGGMLIVGDGLSGLRTARDDQVEAVIEGLFLATQVWVMVEDLWNRSMELADSAAAMADRDGIDDAIQVLRNEARFLSGFVRQQRNGVIDARRRAYESALRAWRIEEEIPMLAQRIGSYLEQASMELDALRSRSDHRRNVLLFGLAFATLTQTGTAMFELVSGERTGLGPAPRPLIAIALGIPFVLAFAYAMVHVAAGWLNDREPNRWRTNLRASNRPHSATNEIASLRQDSGL